MYLEVKFLIVSNKKRMHILTQDLMFSYLSLTGKHYHKYLFNDVN